MWGVAESVKYGVCVVDSLNHLQCDHDHHSVGPPAFLRGNQKSTHELKEPEEVERNGGARL